MIAKNLVELRVRGVALIALICLLNLCGCYRGPAPTYPVSGRVVFPDQSPLMGGNIEFAPKEGKVRTSARGMIADDGTFNLTTFRTGDGAIEGAHRVLIIPARQRGERPGKGKRNVNIDGKYQAFETSGLEANVSSSGKNEFEFVVSPAGTKR